MKKKAMRLNGPASAAAVLILGHGAGAGMDSPFMNFFAESLAGPALRVARFEFPYMAKRRLTGRRYGPDRPQVLEATWSEAIHAFSGKTVVIGGKSMGGRIASIVADTHRVAGLICLGYPFHPIGKPEKLRTSHLKSLQTPSLILQGTRDTFGNFKEVPLYELPQRINIQWLEDGDHSFQPRKSSGRTQADNWQEAVHALKQFLQQKLKIPV